GDIWLADVGEDTFEEINIIQKGGNYGWSCREGYNQTSYGCEGSSPPYVDPVSGYQHNEGASITGGYVYRGSGINGLNGFYLVGDYEVGEVWAVGHPSADVYERYLVAQTSLNISSF